MPSNTGRYFIKQPRQEPSTLTPLLRLKYHDSISDAVADLGKLYEIGKLFTGFQKHLYATTG